MALDNGKMIEADGGHNGELFCIKLPTNEKCSDKKNMKINARSCHETAKKCFKIFEILTSQFCTPLENHSLCFSAILSLLN